MNAVMVLTLKSFSMNFFEIEAKINFSINVSSAEKNFPSFN